MDFPENIKSTKAKIAYWCFYQWYTKNQGQGLVGKFTSAIPEMGWIIVLLERVFGHQLSILQIAGIVFLMFGGTWIAGYFYMRHGLDHIESVVSMQRDQMKKELCKLIKEKEEL